MQPLTIFRLSEQLENVRFEVKKLEQKLVRKIKVGMIGLKDDKKNKMIADFATDFLTSGGFTTEVLYKDLQDTYIDTAIKKSQTQLYCIVGTDDQVREAMPYLLRIAENYPDKVILIAGLNSDELINQLANVGWTIVINENTDQVKCLNELTKLIKGGI